MSYPQRGRGQPIQRGNPARGIGNGSRNQRRAFDFQQRQALESDWNEVREFEPRQEKPRKQNQRSLRWKESRRDEKSKETEHTSRKYDFTATEESRPVDEPLYDIGPHTSAIPIQELYSQNMEYSGYIDQVERTYEMMRGIDPRLDRRMPFSMFQHSMTTVLNCHLLDITLANGETKLGTSKTQDLLPEDLQIPENLYHYMTHIGNTITSTGEEIRFNLPDIAVPRAAEEGIPAGSFGPVNAANHNVYEI